MRVKRDRVGGEREERCTAGEGGEIEQEVRGQRCIAGEGGGEIE